MKKRVILTILIISLISISFVSADLLDSIKKTITGKAEAPLPQDISITVAGTNPVVIEYIETISAQSPLESLTTTVTFEIHITDPDGVADINDSSVDAEFSKIDEITRTTASGCSHISDLDSDTASYSCSIEMQYYDGAGLWNIKVMAADFGAGTTTEDTSASFTYNELKAMTLSLSLLSWPALVPSSTEQTSDNDPAVITNTGNYNGEISVTAYDLVGETNAGESIPATAFSIGTSTGGNPSAECDVPTSATAMENGNTIPIAGSSSNPGPGGTEEIYYCIPIVPDVSSQVYSTTAGGFDWTVFY